MNPGEREGSWRLGVWLAIKAASNDEAAAVIGRALAGLERQMPLCGEPRLRPRDRQHPDDIWVAELEPDMTVFHPIQPDDARTRCSLVQTYFPGEGVTWAVRLNTDRAARFDWPTDIWWRTPGNDEMLLDPAVLAVMIFVKKDKAEG